MADNKPDQGPSTQSKPQDSPTPAPRERRSGADSAGEAKADPTAGAGAEMTMRHEQRVTVPGAPGIDARLDNRAGASRPPLESFPAKPQQIDGPDVMGQVEHTRATFKAREDDVTRKGMFSPGPHGLSDESLREGETSFGTEGLSPAEAGKGAPKAG